MPQPELIAKVVIVGDSGVGKTTILDRYNGERFNPLYCQTRESAIKKAKVEVGRRCVELQIWDTPGSPLCRTITAAYMKEDVQGVIFVFDVTKDDTFFNVQHWVKTTKEYAGGNVKFVFVGNKNDVNLDQGRKVVIESGEQLAVQNNGIYVDASAKTKENIDEIFKKMAESLLDERRNQHNLPNGEHEEQDTNGASNGRKKGGFPCTVL